MISPTVFSEYLQRIGYTGGCEPTAETLRNLHRAHIFSVPFENLDISLGRKIICEKKAFCARSSNSGAAGFVTN